MLFVVVTILGVLLGWLGLQLKWIHDRNEALRWIADFHARATAAQNGTSIPPTKGEWFSPAGAKAAWNLRIFGETGVERLDVYQDWVTPDARYSLDELKALFPEAEVQSVTSRHETSATKEWLVREEAVGGSSVEE